MTTINVGDQMQEPRFPVDIIVDLRGPNGNAFAIMGMVSDAILRAGGSREDVKDYRLQAVSGDYDNLLNASRTFVNLTTIDHA